MAQDLAGSKDPPGTKRYAGSEMIGYRAPKFDEFELPLGPPAYGRPRLRQKPEASGTGQQLYLPGALGPLHPEVMANYKSEFQRLGLTPLYEKAPGGPGRFISLFGDIAINYAVSHANFVLAYSRDNRAHVIYPGGVSKDDWVHNLPFLIKETWVRRPA